MSTTLAGAAFALFAGVSSTCGQTTTVRPTETNDILYNPGMGFADFHFGWGQTPPLTSYPTPRVAYFRWTWSDLEPSPGQYNYALIDNTIAQARQKNESLAIRIMPGMPGWLIAQGVGYLNSDAASMIPDHNNPLFLSKHQQLLQALGSRYNTSTEIDHVDIGSVGCWGEWNSACCPAGADNTCAAYMPTAANRQAITDWYFQYFGQRPLVALAEGTGYANTRGAGWRGDCFGDYGFFSPSWNHMVSYYPTVVAMPEVINAWQKAPVQFEACYTMQDWYNAGFSIDTILQRGLDWHMSVFNGKDSAVPAAWRPKVDAWLKKIGYRFVPTQITHTSTVAPGAGFSVQGTWANRGVAPAYHAWPLAYRLRDNSGNILAQWRSTSDVRKWLPGPISQQDTFTMPASVPGGTYSLDVAVLNEGGTQAFVQLAITGVRSDLWYPISQIQVAAPAPVLAVAPVSVTLALHKQQTFTATLNGATTSKVAWSISPSVGAITAAGMYTSPRTLNGVSQQVVTVTAKSGNVSASATVTVVNRVQ